MYNAYARFVHHPPSVHVCSCRLRLIPSIFTTRLDAAAAAYGPPRMTKLSSRPAYNCTTRASHPRRREVRDVPGISFLEKHTVTRERHTQERLLWAKFPSNKDAISVLPQYPYLYSKPGNVPRMSPDDHRRKKIAVALDRGTLIGTPEILDRMMMS